MTKIKIPPKDHRKVSATEQQDAKDAMPAALKPICNKLRKLAQQQRTHSLEANFEIGAVAKHGLDILRASAPSSYGRGLVNTLAVQAGIEPEHLRNCIKAAETFPRAEYMALIANRAISFRHIIHLTGLPTADARSVFADRAVRSGWTADELVEQIHQQYGNRRPGSGRRPAVPRSADQGLNKLLAATSKFGSFLSLSIFADTFDLPAELKNTSPDAITVATREKAERAAAALDTIAQHAREGACRLRERLPWIDQVLGNKDN